jgi:peptidoglycan-N-acetylglucosamine deacetylase
MGATMRKALFVVALAALAVAASAVGRPPADPDAPPTVAIAVGGRTVRLPEGTTFRWAVAQLGLRPEAGSLVDVGGRILRVGVFPGEILLNGERPAARTPLKAGDRIRVVDGRDRREGLVRETVRIRGGVTPNPQFTLARTPASQVLVRGAISHKLVSVSFEPLGPEVVENAVALTFDDGPSPRYTPQVLAVLRRLHVPATFFAIGAQADAYPELVEAELLAGMSVENHSYGHPQPFAQQPARAIDEQIGLGARSLLRLGADAGLFRPPGGSFSADVVRAAHAHDERTVLWSVDPGDWRHAATPRAIVRKVLEAVRPGSIVLLHDGGGDRSATVAALPPIVQGIRRLGLDLVALPRPTARPIAPERSCLRARAPDGRRRAAFCR